MSDKIYLVFNQAWLIVYGMTDDWRALAISITWLGAYAVLFVCLKREKPRNVTES